MSPPPKTCLNQPGRPATANSYNEGDRCPNCTAAKIEANRLTNLRTGKTRRTSDGRVLAECWCRHGTVMVPERDIGTRTRSCGRPGCRKPSTRFELQLAADELELLRAAAVARGKTMSALVREAIRKLAA